MTASHQLYRHFYPDARLSGTLFFYRRLKRELKPGMRILNLGAGPGDPPGSEAFLARSLRSDDYRVCGCDPDPLVLENRQVDEAKRMESEGRIPWPDDWFDVVFSDYVLEHVSQPEAFLSEVHRVLKPAGVFHFRTPNLYHYVGIAAYVMPYRTHTWMSNRARGLGKGARETYPTYHRMNTTRTLTKLSKAAGFSEMSVVMVEAEPSYLVFNSVAFLTGVAYERIVNRFHALRGIRANIVGRMFK